MPYSSVEDLPAAVKKLPDKRQRQFMHVWNSAYTSCQEKGSGDCEARAFKQAWSVVHKSLVEEDDLLLEFPADTIFSTAALDAYAEGVAKSTAAINDLPDSDFAYIEPGGSKDESGKTVPRSLRHFPIHDANHVRNALARMNQSPFGKKALPKIMAAARRMGIKMDPDKYKSEAGAVEKEILVKGFSLERGLVFGVVYEPDVVDAHDDFASAEEIEKAAHDFLPSAVMNIHHKADLSDVQVVESFLAPVDYSINDEVIRKGSWILVTRILNEELKEAIASGEITGYSLEGTALREEVA